MQSETSRIETKSEVEAFLANMRYLLMNGANITIQMIREVDNQRPVEFTNAYTIADLFPDLNPSDALKKELNSLKVEEYLRTLKDIRFPNRSELREFGRVYPNNKDVYIKIRVELFPLSGQAPIFVMSFHYALIPFKKEDFPYFN